MKGGSRIAAVQALAFDAEMNEPFEIATGSKTEVQNVLVRVRLKNGVEGWGEAAPMTDSRDVALAAARRQGARLVGKDITAWRGILECVDERLGPGNGPARAALSMAVLDAWSRLAALPLRLLFGGAQERVASDVTVTIVPPAQALAAARRIVGLGVRTIKIKIGRDIEEDLERVRAVNSAGKGLRLMLDANQGYGPRQSLRLLAKLKRVGIRPVLFEQPAHRDDFKGLAEVWRLGGVPVAADESAAGRLDVLRLAKLKACQVINIKLMKCGLLEAWDIALIARAAGMGLMIGGMVESSLAMTCSAHFAAGIGGFSFIDLDTPLWFKRDPMKGVTFSRGGIYDLSAVKAGIGVNPGPSLRF
jgi:L-alanine-DL-glutamate epimerase-like enolase superfamily enzyme